MYGFQFKTWVYGLLFLMVYRNQISFRGVNYKNCHIDFSSSIHYSWESFRYYLFLNSFSTENLLSKSITSFSMKESETKNPASYNLKNDIQSAIDYVNKKKMD